MFFFEGDVDLEMFGDMSARMKTSFETKRIPLPFCLKHISFSPSNASDIPEYVYIYICIYVNYVFSPSPIGKDGNGSISLISPPNRILETWP